MHIFEVIYLWFMMASTAILLIAGLFQIGKATEQKVLTPGRYLFTLIMNSIFMFWALEILHKL